MHSAAPWPATHRPRAFGHLRDEHARSPVRGCLGHEIQPWAAVAIEIHVCAARYAILGVKKSTLSRRHFLTRFLARRSELLGVEGNDLLSRLVGIERNGGPGGDQRPDDAGARRKRKVSWKARRQLSR